MKRLVGMALGALLMMSWSAPAGAANPDVEMTVEQAGQAYDRAICVDTRAWRKFEAKVWHGRDRISVAEVRLRLPALKRAALVYSRALAESARRLFNPDDGAWPASVDSMITKVANSAATESYIRRKMGFARNPDQWLRGNGRANSAYERRGTAPTKIRAMLNLAAESTC